MPGLAKRLRSAPRDFCICLMFFTRLPALMQLKEHVSLSRSVHMYPTVGLVVGAIAAVFTTVGTWANLPPLVTAIIAITAMTMATGALHEDGLADTADGFGGGNDKQRKLAIMKDSRIGTYGVLALVFSQILRLILLSEIIQIDLMGAVFSLIGASMISRAGSMLLWAGLPPARIDGLSQGAGQPDKIALGFALTTTGIFMLPILYWGTGPLALVMAILATSSAVILMIRICKHQISGQTGDTIGATQQICELVFMTFLLISI